MPGELLAVHVVWSLPLPVPAYGRWHPMNCEANGCTAALTPKPLAGSAMGGPSPWVVTDIPPGWCVRQVENTDVGSSRVVVLCPLHGAGVVPRPTIALPGGIDRDDLDDDGPWADPRLEVARLRSVIEDGAASSCRLAARIVELEADVTRLTEIAATADADRLPLAMDLENVRAEVAALRSALNVAERRFCDIGSASAAPHEDIKAACDTAVGDIEEALARTAP